MDHASSVLVNRALLPEDAQNGRVLHPRGNEVKAVAVPSRLSNSNTHEGEKMIVLQRLPSESSEERFLLEGQCIAVSKYDEASPWPCRCYQQQCS